MEIIVDKDRQVKLQEEANLRSQIEWAGLPEDETYTLDRIKDLSEELGKLNILYTLFAVIPQSNFATGLATLQYNNLCTVIEKTQTLEEQKKAASMLSYVNWMLGNQFLAFIVGRQVEGIKNLFSYFVEKMNFIQGYLNNNGCGKLAQKNTLEYLKNKKSQ